MLGCGAVSYRAIPETSGWGLEFLNIHGRQLSGVGPFFTKYLASAPTKWGIYSPLCPEPLQRNRVFGAAKLASINESRPPLVRAVYEPLGLHRPSHIRVLICDGPFLLTWLGGWREEAFGLQEEHTLRRVAAALRQRLRVDRVLSHAASLESTALALEAIVAPAFWVRTTGAIEFANEAGRMIFDRYRGALVRMLRSAVTAPKSVTRKGISVFPLAAAGVPVGALIVIQDAGASLQFGLTSTAFDSTPGRAFEASIVDARTRWGLTPRHVSIVRLLVRGDSNKDIADKLGLSPGTIEVYLSEIFRRAKVESRLQLVAKLWV
ncbi:MAG TPA: helix-turn-helix transcriptional regulator [Polyangiaceae bacterium]|nr:helix-turn-helix transcriptional regulator [Polyangiaceae bacterium]